MMDIMTDYRTAPRKTNDSPIARLRMERGITQGQLAEKVGCLSKDISRWENGVYKPSAAYKLIKYIIYINGGDPMIMTSAEYLVSCRHLTNYPDVLRIVNRTTMTIIINLSASKYANIVILIP